MRTCQSWAAASRTCENGSLWRPCRVETKWLALMPAQPRTLWLARVSHRPSSAQGLGGRVRPRLAASVRRSLCCSACDGSSSAGAAARAEREQSVPRPHGEGLSATAVPRTRSWRAGGRGQPVQNDLLGGCASSRAVETCVLSPNRVRGGTGFFGPRGCRWYFPRFACPAQSSI